MKEFIDKLIERLEEKFKYNSEQAELYRKGSDKDAYFREKKDLYMDRANTYGEIMRIVNQFAEENKHCIKSSCSNCEVYDTEKHYCPKWCDIIKGTMAEIEENHNDWIPCSERLPEDFRAVFITAIALNGTSYTEIGKWNGNQWFHGATNTRIDIAEVIAWCELPAPYTEVDHHD